MADQLPWLEDRELFFLLSFICNYVISVQRGYLFLLVLGMGCAILLWHSRGLPYNYFEYSQFVFVPIIIINHNSPRCSSKCPQVYVIDVEKN